MPNPFDFLLNDPAREESTWKWATVTGLSPLRVRLDQEPLSLGVTPINLAGPLVEGDRVWVQMHRSRGMKGAQPIIHGTGTPDTGWIDLPIQSGWQTAYGPVQVRLTGGLVYVRGEVYNGRTGSSEPIVTLPAGMRPEWRIRVPTGWGSHLSNGAYLALDTDGQIWSNSAPSSSPGFSLEGIPPFFPAGT